MEIKVHSESAGLVCNRYILYESTGFFQIVLLTSCQKIEYFSRIISGSESFTRWLAPGSELGASWERAGVRGARQMLY